MDTVMELRAESPVVIFSKSTCCMCHTIKQLISSYGTNPTVYELDQMSNGQHIERALMSLGCRPSVPAVFIGQEFIGGADKVMSLQVNGRLVRKLIDAGAIFQWGGNP